MFVLVLIKNDKPECTSDEFLRDASCYITWVQWSYLYKYKRLSAFYTSSMNLNHGPNSQVRSFIRNIQWWLGELNNMMHMF